MNQVIQLAICKIPIDFTLKLSTLSHAQRSRAKGFTGTRLREYIASRTLIAALLEGDWFIDESDITRLYAYDSNSSSLVKVSLSHSNNWLAVGLAPLNTDISLGVDIEKVRGNWSAEKAAFFCNESQCQQGLSLENNKQADFFTQLWTKKEAYFKATQKPFVQKDFGEEPNIYSEKLNEDFFVSVYSDPALKIERKLVKLASS